MRRIEFKLRSQNWWDRKEPACRMDWNPTPQQVENGLNDGTPIIRTIWAGRMDFTPTPEQIERGLTDAYWEVRITWAERMDWKHSESQLRRGLEDSCLEVRAVWVQRHKLSISTCIDDVNVESSFDENKFFVSI